MLEYASASPCGDHGPHTPTLSKSVTLLYCNRYRAIEPPAPPCDTNLMSQATARFAVTPGLNNNALSANIHSTSVTFQASWTVSSHYK